MTTEALCALKNARVIFEISLKECSENFDSFNICKTIVLDITKIDFYNYENLQNLLVFKFLMGRNTTTDIFS